MAGVLSLFAVTHQGPAQGGKAGDSLLSIADFNVKLRKINKFFYNHTQLFTILQAAIEAQF